MTNLPKAENNFEIRPRVLRKMWLKFEADCSNKTVLIKNKKRARTVSITMIPNIAYYNLLNI